MLKISFRKSLGLIFSVCSLWSEPVKNCSFVCYGPPIELVNTSLAGYQNWAVKECILWVAATKSEVSDVCTRSLHGDIRDLELGRENVKMAFAVFPGREFLGVSACRISPNERYCRLGEDSHHGSSGAR